VREIRDVIERIIREVPKDKPWRERLRLIEDWDRLANALERYLGDPDEEWKRKIATIFAGRDSI
jgi:hypothetical protein